MNLLDLDKAVDLTDELLERLMIDGDRFAQNRAHPLRPTAHYRAGNLPIVIWNME